MKKRRSLTPGELPTPPQGDGAPEGSVHAMRRGGARREVSERVYLVGKGGEMLEGWALNVSKGGVRVVLEDPVELGAEYNVTVGDPDKGGVSARGRIVWLQEEPDGMIAGIEFTGISGTHPSQPPPPSDSD